MTKKEFKDLLIRLEMAALAVGYLQGASYTGAEDQAEDLRLLLAARKEVLDAVDEIMSFH